MKKLSLILIIFSSFLLNAQSLNFTMDWSNNSANFKVGSIQQITWESNGVENIKLEFSTNAGKVWRTIVNNYPSSLGTFDWTIPNTPSIYCKIRISDIENQDINSTSPDDPIISDGNTYQLFWHFTIYSENNSQWTHVDAPINVEKIKFRDNLYGLAWGQEGVVETMDGGNSWKYKSEFAGMGTSFFEPNMSWEIISNESQDTSFIVHTSDGGASWTKQLSIPTPSEGEMGKIFITISNLQFIDKNNGWFTIETIKGKFEYFTDIYHTSNGGETWEIIDRSEYGPQILTMNFVDKNLGWQKINVFFNVNPYCELSPIKIFKTIDGGANWEETSAPTIEYKYSRNDVDLSFINQNLYFMNSESILPSICDPNSNRKMLRNANILYKSTNKGPKKIHFFDENIGWFSGNSFSLFKAAYELENVNNFKCQTLDGGKTWELKQFNFIGLYPHIKTISSTDGKTFWGVDGSGIILKYENLGLNNINYKFTFKPNSDSVYTLTNGVFVEGENYFVKPFTLSSPYDQFKDRINRLEGSRITLDKDAINEDVSLDIRFMGMDENGSITNPIDNAPLFMFLGIEVTGEQSGVTSFEDFYYFNEGKKARIIIPRTGKFLELLTELEIDESNISFAYIKGGEYFDEGLEWEIKEGEEGKVDSLCLYLDHFSKIVGGKNLLTSVHGNEENLPTRFSLEQNYPNPFNPVTTINYNVPSNGSTSIHLNVFDVLGREVHTLVNEPKQAGRYSVSFDASQLSSGIYYYQLNAGEFIETKKMVLMK